MRLNIIKIAVIALGGVAGYFYWKYYGCTNGCAITAVWWRTTLFGMLFGYLLSDAVIDLFTKK